jgi:hypothetical protein
MLADKVLLITLIACSNGPDSNYTTTRCQSSVVHPGWSFTTGYNDVSLCFLPVSAPQQPIALASGEEPTSSLFAAAWHILFCSPDMPIRVWLTVKGESMDWQADNAL